MRKTCVVIMMVMMFCKGIVAKAPSGCQIYTLNGTFSGETWTPSVDIKNQVTLALKSPTEDPWHEINVEFESETGASVGTLQLLREGSSAMTLTLSSWPTTVHSNRQKTQTLKSHGALNNLLKLQDWVYLNISAGESVTVDLRGSSVVFQELSAKEFKKLYVRVPEEEVLQVAFNCGKAKSVEHVTVTEAPEPEKSGTKVIIVALVLAGLVIGVAAFWCIGRKKRNALVQTMGEKEQEHLDRCQECGDPIEEEETATCEDKEKVEEGEALMSKDLNKCQECGDMIDDQEDEAKEDEALSEEEECVCSKEE
ncbi:uncharacterized protein [Palaemon carinicauda]|uniref:uncharacterized protein n=1 Tax=Palaemon carinicauda TaxID=392227 RepID=UPI0035B611DD